MDIDFAELGFGTNFGILDWCIVVGYLIAIVSIGVYIRKYIASATDFMVAGRGLKTFLAIATMIGTEMGLITVMYSAQKGFTGGFAAFHIAFAAAIVTLLVGLSGFIVVPLRRLKVMTIPEFYEKRFGRNVRILGGTILAFSGILNMGMFLKAGAMFVFGVTGMHSWVHLKIIMTVLLGMVLLYTTLGGMVSVAVLDYIQFVVLSVSLVVASVLSIRFLGWTNIVDTVMEGKGMAGFNPFDEAGFGWTYVVWMFFLGLVSCAIWQTAVIRACSAKSTQIVKRIYVLSSVGFLIRFLIPYFFGIAAFVFVFNTTALREVFFPASGEADADLSLLAMPIFLSRILPTGFIGIISAGMLAAFMSTHDSYLLCWSSVLTQDVVAPWFKDGLSSKTRLLLTRIFIVTIGLFILIWGLWYPLGQDLWDYMAISGAIYFIGGFSLLAFGLYWKRASRVGAYLSLFSAFFAILGLTPVQETFSGVLAPVKRLLGLPPEEVISSAVVGLIVLATAVVLMVVGSLLFPDKGQNSYHAEREES
ncbi:MAG: sodium:solute symporter family protein [Phycisphaerales bacterium]|nr:MAG: sodium:solute symporter family protein [Phycisphaerales bacterium]